MSLFATENLSTTNTGVLILVFPNIILNSIQTYFQFIHVPVRSSAENKHLLVCISISKCLKQMLAIEKYVFSYDFLLENIYAFAWIFDWFFGYFVFHCEFKFKVKIILFWYILLNIFFPLFTIIV